ncbi:hypothetical protein [Halobacillus sp. BAB-2008]|uniref:hypothetical protein n=1 Tax=Halobacillus sp. BAB-2008 TaxID=1246484 RepID=UPI0002A51A6F|nr:hypothetical protein [Halobacillus sp. BAB-2008]ELK49010.1 hypothetical protein D479_00210 [Halobacillus sp. BAB-2008]
MNKKRRIIMIIYAVVMVGLLLVTFVGEWNPSNYSYTWNEGTLTIEQGLTKDKVAGLDVEEQIDDVLKFTLAVSEEQSQWNVDLLAVGILLPFLLLVFVPDQRPFQKYLSKGWYRTLVLAILILYGAYTIPGHIVQIGEIKEMVRLLAG